MGLRGLCPAQISIVFNAFVVSRKLHAWLAWGLYLTSAQIGKINGFLKPSCKHGFCKNLLGVSALSEHSVSN